jgi:phosphotransferase system HPr (HPr) family protein
MFASSDGLAVTSVVLPADLHARPAGQVSLLVAGFDADVELVAGARTARAVSVLAVMGLGAQAGQQIEVRASGPDAARAASAVAAVLAVASSVAG